MSTEAHSSTRDETKLEEMLRLQQPPAGYDMTATAFVTRLRREGDQKRRAREEPRGICVSSVQKNANSQ